MQINNVTIIIKNIFFFVVSLFFAATPAVEVTASAGKVIAKEVIGSFDRSLMSKSSMGMPVPLGLEVNKSNRVGEPFIRQTHVSNMKAFSVW